MNCSPFSCPIFLGHPEARGRCSQGERMLYGRDLCRSGGTGKAEAAKLPGAGMARSSAQENARQKNATYPKHRVRHRKQTRVSKECEKSRESEMHFRNDT